MVGLVVIDMQRGLFDAPDSRHDRQGVVRRINELARAVREAQGLVIFIQHDGEEGEAFAPGSAEWEFLPELEQREEDAIVHKRACDSFYETELASLLEDRGISHLLFCGCATDFCVDTTVRAAASRNYRVTVAEDAHTTADRPHLDAVTIIRHHNWVWENLILPRSRVEVCSTKQLIDQLNGTAPGKHMPPNT